MFDAIYSDTTTGLLRRATEIGLRKEDVVGIVRTDNGSYCMIYYLEDESV